MTNVQHNLSTRARRARRMRRRVRATSDRPKLVITRSNRYLFLQVIDETGQVLAASSDMALLKSGQLERQLTKTQRAAAVGRQLAAGLQQKKITKLSVDRGACQFHGRIKAAVEEIRASGIEA